MRSKRLSVEFPRRIPEKLKAIRKRLRLAPAECARRVGTTVAAIEAYESDAEDLPAGVLWRYARLADVPVENILYDDRDLWLGHRVN